MFNAERLLGQLMGDSVSGQLGGRKRKRSSGMGSLLGGMSGGTQAKLGVGLLGLAFAAYEHYQQTSRPSPNVAPGTGTTSTWTATSTGTATAATSSVPPPPGASTQPPPPPPAARQQSENALHLIRAMVCAANADGLIDAEEREGILGRARDAGLSEADITALDVEIRAPMTLEQLVVRTPEQLRDEVYAAALIAITADTDHEQQFLDRLATQLNLDQGSRRQIHQQLGLG